MSVISSRLFRYALIAFSAATVLAALGAAQVHAQYAIFRVEEIPWSECLTWAAIEWYSWALLVPFVAMLATRYRFDVRAGIVTSVLVHVIAALLFAAAHASMQTAGILLMTSNTFELEHDFRSAVTRLLISELHWELISYAMIVAATHVGLYLGRAQSEAVARQELETQTVLAQLAALKRQMQPHFLFNALNAQVSMLPEGSAAQLFTIRLADMLRIILRSSNQTTASLSEEMVLVDAYLEVERARFGPRLRASTEIADAMLELRLPSLILQPLVENAITHGIGQMPGGGAIVIRASQNETEATIEVLNTCGGMADNATKKAGQQITLANARQRLALMYGSLARLEVGNAERNLFRSAIILPLTSNELEPRRGPPADTDS